MIAACPTCGSRFRIERVRLPSGGARLRCPRCRSVFRVRAPAHPSPKSAAAIPAATATPGNVERERLVLIADSQVEAGKATASALADWGLQPILVHDGVEAILTVQRMLPRVVVLDAALPKMLGFQICELMKRNESLRQIHVVLVGAIHHRESYRRDPGELYGADAYLERPQLPEALRAILRGFGVALGGGPAPSIAQPEEPGATAGSAVQRGEGERSPDGAARPRSEDESAPDDPEIAKAERLARIIVSDVVLYNQEKFDAAVRSGNVIEAMDGEMREGRAHFQQRIEARVRQSRDFLGDELLRVAKLRGGG